MGPRCSLGGSVYERTLVILKPDALMRGLVGKIITRFEEAGLTIAAAKVVSATPAHLDRHFPSSEEWLRNMGARACERMRKELRQDPAVAFGSEDPLVVGMVIAQGCRAYYLSGPLVALVLFGPGAVHAVRTLIGNTLPSKAAKGTIRGDFGIRENMENLVGGAAQNLVHASDSVEEARREIAAWFK